MVPEESSAGVDSGWGDPGNCSGNCSSDSGFVRRCHHVDIVPWRYLDEDVEDADCSTYHQ